VWNGLTDADDGKALVDEYRFLTNVAPGPVRATVALLLGEGDKSRPVSSRLGEVMNGEYATHFWWTLVCEEKFDQSPPHDEFPKVVTRYSDKIRVNVLLLSLYLK